MADLIATTLRRLAPQGTAGRYKGQALNLVDALAVSAERIKEFFRAVQDEANPETANAMIDEWLALLRITPPYGATLGDKQMLASAAWTSLGGQSLDYINTQIRKAYPNAFIYENPLEAEELRMGEAEMGELECSDAELTQLLYYVVAGYVNWAIERYGLQGIISHIIPAHLSQIFQCRVQYDGDVALCGIATTGRSICGRATTLYAETDKEIALCAIGRCGALITGRTA